MPFIRLTWWGHATVLVDDGTSVLTDPVLTDHPMHLYRRAGRTPSDVAAEVDVVVVSHLHADHLHLRSLARLRSGTPVLVPRGAGALLGGLDVEAVEVVVGDVVRVGHARIRAVPAVHGDRRWPAGRLRAQPVGYLIQGRGTTYFAGDTAEFAGMAELAPDLDVALLPVGGWGPWLRGSHLTPATAAACLRLLRPRVVVPIHYGTFWPRGLSRIRTAAFEGPGRRFTELARRAAPDVDVRLLAPSSCTAVRV